MRRPHATLVGVASAFALTGRRDLGTLLAAPSWRRAGGAAALPSLIRTAARGPATTPPRPSCSACRSAQGIALVAGLTARGVPGSGGLEQFLLGHTAALTRGDALLLAAAAVAAVVVMTLTKKKPRSWPLTGPSRQRRAGRSL